MARNFIELKKEARLLMTKSEMLAGEMGFEAERGSIRDLIGAFDKKELMVVAVGEAKRGKSSLMNMLLEEKEPIFPVDMNVCTNVITVVRYGESETVSVLLADAASPGGQRAVRITRDEIPDYVSEKGNPNNFKNVLCLEVFLPNEILKDGVVFVDTPGVGSMNPLHAEVTYATLPNADVIIFVTDSLAGMTETELEFLKRGYKYSQNILFALTKKDMNADYSVIMEDNRKKIKSAIPIADEDIKMIPVSSTAKRRYLENGNKAMYRNSCYPELEEAVWSMITRKRAQIVILPFIEAAGAELEKVSASIIAQGELLDADKDRVDKLIAELNEESGRLEQFETTSADWRSRISLRLGDISNDASMLVRDLGRQARDIYDEASSRLGIKICKKKVYDNVLNEINGLFGTGAITVREQIAAAIDELVGETNNKLLLDMDPERDAVARIVFSSQNELNVRFRKKSVREQAITKGMNITRGTTAITTVSAIIGGIAGFVLSGGNPLIAVDGAQLGASVGAGLSVGNAAKELVSNRDMSDVSAVTSAFTQMINTQVDNMTRMVNRALSELREELINSFAKNIKVRRTEIQQNMVRIRDNIKLSGSDIPKKQAALKAQNEKVSAGLSAIDAIVAEINELSAAVTPAATMAAKTAAAEERKAPQHGDGIDYGFI